VHGGGRRANGKIAKVHLPAREDEGHIGTDDVQGQDSYDARVVERPQRSHLARDF
jgi:hypothetical protein